MLNMDNGGTGMMSSVGSTARRKPSDVGSDQFPAGLRVLVVDDDPTCLKILERMLQNCLYKVTTCSRAVDALSILRDRKYGFDLVISDVHMPDMDGFKLLEHIGLEMDLPVIMMSVDDKKDVVMKGVTHGACDYLIKPVRIEAIKNIWQHVVRKRRNELKELEQSGSLEDSDRHRKTSDDADYASSANEGTWRNSKRRKEEEDDMEERDDTSTLKKPRVVWSVDLHQQFVAAVNQLGIDKAVPKKILELMNVPGLTRENVASHLQKYRLYLRRLSGVSQHQNGLNMPFMGSHEANSALMSSLDGLDLQILAVSGQLPQQNLTMLQAGGLARSTANAGIDMPLDQRNPFSTENSKLRFGVGQEQLSNNTRRGNLLHGHPVTMEPKQLHHLNQPVQSHGSMGLQISEGNMGLQISEGSACFINASTASLGTCQLAPADTVHGHQRSSLMMQMAQFQSREECLNEISGSCDSGIPLSIGQKRFSNEIPGRVLGRNGAIVNGRGAAYNPLSQAVVDFPMNMELPRNGFPLGTAAGVSSLPSTGMFQDGGILEVRGLGAFNANYDITNELRQTKTQDWEVHNADLNLEASQHAKPTQGNLNFSPSVLAHQAFASNEEKEQNENASTAVKSMVSLKKESQHENTESIAQRYVNLVVDNSLRVKAESMADLSCESMLLAKQFGQDDLMSAVFKQQQGVGPVEIDFNFDGYHVDNILE